MNRAAAQLLQLCAFLASEPIPFDLFNQHPRVLPEPLRTAANDRLSFARAVRHLVDRALAHQTGKSLTVHRVLAQAVRRSMSEQQQRDMAGIVRELLARHLPRDVANNQTTRATWRALMPHVLTATDAGIRPHDPAGISGLLIRAGNYLRAEGETGAGLLLLRAVRIDEGLHGRDHPYIARHLTSLALTLRELAGRPDKARPLLERALHIDERALGPDHPDVAEDLRKLAAVMNDLGETAAASDMLNRAMMIDETGQGSDPQQSSSI
jgi:hypothetical protein